MASLEPPALSAFDPPENGEGSIDPFSTQAGYERLAELILPFITVRMARPRFLTAMCVAAHACREFTDRIAADQQSPPWLVFEWYVVEAHARLGEQPADVDLLGVPGLRKVRSARSHGRAVGAATYLRTPTVFGFHGVYRRLALGLQILTEDLQLDDGGFELLRLWEQEQGLPGFIASNTGSGAELRKELSAAVQAGLAKAHTSRPGSWPAWRSITTHLTPAAPGPQEAQWLYERLCSTDLRNHPRDPLAQQMRKEMVGHLIERGGTSSIAEETAFVRDLADDRKTSPELRTRLRWIDAYEALCQPLHDVLDLALFLSTAANGVGIGVQDLLDHPAGQKLAHQLDAACARAAETPGLIEAEPSVVDIVTRYGDSSEPRDLLRTCLEHHVDAQRNKPPDGKRPWFEWVGGNRVAARMQYQRHEAPAAAGDFVHAYRCSSVTNFLRDLRRIGG